MKSTGNSKSYIEVLWPVPSTVRAYTTTRIGGNSIAPFDQFNLAKHVGDDQQSVIKNRLQLIQELGLKRKPLWLDQIHSSNVIDADQVGNVHSGKMQSAAIQADASYSAQTNQVCVVMTADCLPILLADKKGQWVASVHAGWRGLVDGIIQKTIAAYPGKPSELVAWLGPAISQKHFEVGAEVKAKFEQKNLANSIAFIATGNNKYHCDLYQIARMTFQQKLIDVYGGDYCSFSQSSQFYSYRRDGDTGRMASLIWIENQESIE